MTAGKCTKHPFRTRQIAVQRARAAGFAAEAYRCRDCGEYHITNRQRGKQHRHELPKLGGNVAEKRSRSKIHMGFNEVYAPRVSVRCGIDVAMERVTMDDAKVTCESCLGVMERGDVT